MSINANSLQTGRHQAVPLPAALLGAAGLIPFIAGTLYLLLGPLTLAQVVLLALVGYGAIILSFMGAIHWGLAMRLPPDQAAQSGGWMAVSVLPALLGWGALLLALLGMHLLSLTALVIGFIVVYFIDLAAIRSGTAAAWYRRLRLPLTAVVVVCLGLTAITFV